MSGTMASDSIRPPQGQQQSLAPQGQQGQQQQQQQQQQSGVMGMWPTAMAGPWYAQQPAARQTPAEYDPT